MKVERCQKSIKNMRAKRQASRSSNDTVVAPISPGATGEPKRCFLQPKRQTSSSSSDEVTPHRPPKLFFARKPSGGRAADEPPASPALSIKSPRSPGLKGLCRRRSQEEPHPQQQQPSSKTTSTSTLVEVALAQVSATPAPRSPSPRRQTSIDTLVEEPVSSSEIGAVTGVEKAQAQAQKREGLTDQQLMLIIVVLAVSQCLLIARLRAAAT